MSSASIFRREGQNAEGGGYVSSVSYNSTDDTFTVDGLAFDGDNEYDRVTTPFGTLGGYALYEGSMSYEDAETGTEVSQLMHRALYGVSSSGRTEFAIARSGGYVPYGFGGFIYQRNGEVTLPTSGQASYSGGYGGVRVFDGSAGLEYTQGDMTVDIDFEDFNTGSGVKGEITNREVFDSDGNDITSDIATALEATTLPTLTFVIQPGVADDNGEIAGSVISYSSDGAVLKEYESGTYYAILADDDDPTVDADEIVGIIVMTSDDPRVDGRTVQETGGFILYR
ncbi:hypothetical protein SAMN06297129_1948 [Pseudooceanicola antarcticus]|uniref:Uncharacterized protein n=1 Tax=Pseudooceanicola antarcticus TaxID=1247613 RepID=A0A285IV44_9RHOB|nr:hypothetical protein [Pseudooceanicola antarcticus]PJE31909.1 hypothetical protein CVM39_02070 [Pseudooceanicola antarcticus]SNY50801.1 hypothetical protein SAMN06297129_1948 [Pseudooceanicola antarcticus]